MTRSSAVLPVCSTASTAHEEMSRFGTAACPVATASTLGSPSVGSADKKAAAQAVTEMPSMKKQLRKLTNKKVAPTPTGLATALSRKRHQQWSRTVFKGWRLRASQRAAWRQPCDPEDEGTPTLEEIAAAKFREQVLRLTLFGWRQAEADTCSGAPFQRTSSLISSFMAESTSAGGASSLPSETGSFADSLSLDGCSVVQDAGDDAACWLDRIRFLGALPPWSLPHVAQGKGKRKRIGIDLGGVIFIYRASKWVWKALAGVRRIVEIFSAENVFILSRVEIDGPMHMACCEELTRPGGFLEMSGIPLDNVVFVPAVSGRFGKGAIAACLGLTHFVDDKCEVLRSVYADECGNSGDLIREFGGKLFHFEHGGRGKLRPCCPAEMSSGFKALYCAVSGWPELLDHFDEDIHPRTNEAGDGSRKRFYAPLPKTRQDGLASTSFVASAVAVHRMPVGVAQDAAFDVAARLIGGFQEIVDFAGVRILLRGQGSPQPQPKSDEQHALSIEIRSKCSGRGHFETAVSLVEDLLRDVVQQHDEFKASLEAARR